MLNLTDAEGRGGQGEGPELPTFVAASMPAPVGGRGDVTVTATFADGTERTLAAWADAVGERDRLLLSRSPDGGRAAVALGKFVRTLDVRDGSVIARAPIGHSEPSLVFGWPEQGAVVVRDADARSGPDLPIGDGWTLRVRKGIVLDDGFSGGFTGAAPMVSVPVDHPDAGAALAEGASRIRAEAQRRAAVAASARSVEPSIFLSRGDGDWVAVDGISGSHDLHWPPVVSPEAILLRRSTKEIRIAEPESAADPGVSYESGPAHPWLVTSAGEVSTVPAELAVSPICVLPDGRYLLPGASETWRDDADEPMATFGRDGHVQPWVVGGSTPRAGRIIAALAPDLLPEVLPADLDHGAWTDDEDMWVHAGRVSHDRSSVLLLLTEGTWWPDWHEPEACAWVVAEITLADGALRLVARGARAEGDAFTVAL